MVRQDTHRVRPDAIRRHRVEEQERTWPGVPLTGLTARQDPLLQAFPSLK